MASHGRNSLEMASNSQLKLDQNVRPRINFGEDGAIAKYFLLLYQVPKCNSKDVNRIFVRQQLNNLDKKIFSLVFKMTVSLAQKHR